MESNTDIINRMTEKYGYDLSDNVSLEFAEALMIEKEKQLRLGDVSQQRELLIDYSNYLCKEYFNRHLEPDDCDVDEYLKSINCG
jgi:hypothetical protein